MSGHTKINFDTMTAGEIEEIVDKGLRHRSGKTSTDYLAHWVYIGRHFAYATHDDSWGEFEKEFSIIISRLVMGERRAAANEAKIEALVKALGNICQRANELGTGELSLLNAIHDMHYMATAALTSAGEK